MKINKILSFILICALLLTMAPVAVYASVFDAGDYIQFGIYNGEPIVWRVIRENGNDLEIISDKVITIKAFDAARADGSDYQKIGGSAQWTDSNIRTWLNSAETNVSYTHLPNAASVTANAYDAEAGFLANFTDEEKSYIKPVSVSSALNDAYTNSASTGSAVLSYDRDATYAGTNIDSAYVASTTDLIYLPSVEDMEYIQNDMYTFNTEYQRAYPTLNAVTASDTQFTGLITDNTWYYWLRDAMYGSDDSLVRCVTPSGTVEYAAANNGYIGVRPMCTVDAQSMGIVNGDGSVDSPYCLSTEPWVGLNGDAKQAIKGTHINVTLFKANIPDDATVEIYLNGESVTPQYAEDTNTFPVEAGYGINTVEAKVISADYKTLAYAAFSFTGLDVQYLGTPVFKETFDDSSSENLSDMMTGDGPSSGENGEYYWASTDGTTNVSSIIFSQENGDGIATINMHAYTALGLTTAHHHLSNTDSEIMGEVTFKIGDFGKYPTGVLTAHWYNSSGDRSTWSPFSIDASGNFYVNNIKPGRIQVGTIEIGKWYNIKLIVNNENATATAIMDNLDDDAEEAILFYNEEISVTDVKYVQYFSTTVRGYEGKSVSFSDFNVGACQFITNPQMLGNIYRGANAKTASVYVINTTGAVLDANLAVAVYDKDKNLREVKLTEANLKADEGRTYDIVFDKIDIADTDIIRAFLLDDLTNIVPLSPTVDIVPTVE